MSALSIPPTVPVASAGPRLRDIHLPPEPSWWPLAPGWWALAVLLLAALSLTAWWWRRHRHGVRRREQVLYELDGLARQYQLDGDQSALASGLHQLLRRVARRHDAMAARQRGDAWRQTLARVPIDAVALDRLLTLEQAIYRPQPSFDHAVVVAAVRQWLFLALKPTAWKAVATEGTHA